ncbi:MAG: DUF2975 domain-containing protein [Caulobacter sp.]|nr:DUF2975 domain-containing protein [Caulobacter sp.]
MRTLGPGSISSFLKIILDVTWFLLWGLIGSLALAGIVMLLLSFNTDLIAKIEIKTDIGTTDHIGATLTAGLFGGALYASGWLLIVGQLRRIFKTLTAGDPFHPDNVGRLRLIGLCLAGLTVGTWIYTTAAALMLPGLQSISAGFSPTTWFSVMVVFVLAEVFREGARLRNEAELTI